MAAPNSTSEKESAATDAGATVAALPQQQLTEKKSETNSERNPKKRALPSSSCENDSPNNNKKRAIPLVTMLQQASLQNKPKGWRAKELGFESRKGRRAEFRQAFFRDCTELKEHLSSCDDEQEEMKPDERDVTGKFQKGESTTLDPLSITYLSFSWGVGKNFYAELLKTKEENGSIGATKKKKKKNVTVKEVADGAVKGSAVRDLSQSNASTTVASLPQQQHTEEIPETLIVYQYAHAAKYKRGWRARQKGPPNWSVQARTFQQESLRDLVALRGSCLDEIFDTSSSNQEGPKSLKYLSFAWDVSQDYFHSLLTKCTDCRNFVEALGQQQGVSVTNLGTTTTLVKQELPKKRKSKASKKPAPNAGALSQNSGSRTDEPTAMASNPPTAADGTSSDTLVNSLRQACLQNKPKGWRAKELGFESKRGRRIELRQAFFRDCTELKGYLSSRAQGKLKHDVRDDTGKFQKGEGKIDPLSITYLSYSWGVGKNFYAELLKTKHEDGSIGATGTKKKKNVTVKEVAADGTVEGSKVGALSQSSGAAADEASPSLPPTAATDADDGAGEGPKVGASSQSSGAAADEASPSLTPPADADSADQPSTMPPNRAADADSTEEPSVMSPISPPTAADADSADKPSAAMSPNSAPASAATGADDGAGEGPKVRASSQSGEGSVDEASPSLPPAAALPATDVDDGSLEGLTVGSLSQGSGASADQVLAALSPNSQTAASATGADDGAVQGNEE